MSNYTLTRPMRPHRFVERAIIRQLCKELAAQGWELECYYDGEVAQLLAPDPVGQASAVFELFTATDSGRLHVHRGAESGWIYLISGNGPNCLSDYSVNLEAVCTKVFLR